MDEITKFLTDDHRRIDALWGAYLAAAGSSKSVRRLEAFRDALIRHIAREETAIFPAFEEKNGQEAAVVAEAMRLQHDAMKSQLGDLLRTLARGLPSAGLEAALREGLSDHNRSEEGFIFPWIDSALSPSESREILASLRLWGAI